MGFIMQMTGIFTIIPIILSFVFNESSATIALFITATAFLALGFILNALCERKELTFKQSSSLIILVFIFLSILGAIPYLYIPISNGDTLKMITDAIFESASGFTTTGFSVIPDLSVIPKSILFYRALTQFIGGIGIVLILLTFFYPEDKLKEFSRSMGFPENYKIKKTFYLILFIYFVSSVIMLGVGFLFGYKDIITLISLIFSALSTGGFTPLNDITNVAIQSPMNYILIISMILGASNFIVLAGLFRLKIKEFIKSEVSIFIILAALSVAVMQFFFKFSLFDSIFHVISAMSTTGFSYLSISGFPSNPKLFFVFLMFVGGASFSTAGGIKIFRLILMYKAMKKAITDSITRQDTPIKMFGKEYSNGEVINSLVLILLMAGIILVSSMVVSSYGFSLLDSIFEVTSAITATGLGVGIIGPSLAFELKWLFMLLMVLGRVEIFAFLIMISRTKEQKKSFPNQLRDKQ